MPANKSQGPNYKPQRRPKGISLLDWAKQALTGRKGVLRGAEKKSGKR